MGGRFRSTGEALCSAKYREYNRLLEEAGAGGRYVVGRTVFVEIVLFS
jgi:hypothetical protein